MNVYKFLTHVVCPVDGTTNYLQVEIRSVQTVMCEEIQKARDELAGKRLIQEAYTELLQSMSGGSVQVTGTHPGGIEVITS